MAKKTKKQESEMSFELIGGIFIVEKWPDGRETREEIDRETVLKLLVESVTKGLEYMLEDEESLKLLKDAAKAKKAGKPLLLGAGK